jgi:succinate dehydrogenase / fumarate reductase cytochrome b subunit
MAVSILHRITGTGLALVGMGLFTWWLYAAAAGPDAYATFTGWASWKWALLIWVPLSWALFQHTLSGLRHFVMDAGAGYELGTNKFWAWMVLLLALLFTALLWAWIIYGRNA